MNGDGVVDFFDIDAFNNVVTNGTAYYDARIFEYDEENRLIAVYEKGSTSNTLLMEYVYDALGRRTHTIDYTGVSDPLADSPTWVETRHVYSGLTVVEEYVRTNVTSTWTLVREFVHGDRFPEPLAMVDHSAAGAIATVGTAETLYYVHDALGSVIGLTDAGGTLVERYVYDQ